MKPRSAAFTKVELLVVVAVLILLVGALIPAVLRARAKPARIRCINNLKNIGLAFRIFATDTPDLSTTVPAKDGGSLDYVDDPTAIWRHFSVLANELSTPKIVVCPQDADRIEATSFLTNKPAGAAGRNVIPFNSNSNISYFVGVETREIDPRGILAGDRNVTNGSPELTFGVAQVASLETNHTTSRGAGWTHHTHKHRGNILLGDGSAADKVDTLGLRKMLRESGATNNRIAKP